MSTLSSSLLFSDDPTLTIPVSVFVSVSVPLYLSPIPGSDLKHQVSGRPWVKTELSRGVRPRGLKLCGPRCSPAGLGRVTWWTIGLDLPAPLGLTPIFTDTIFMTPGRRRDRSHFPTVVLSLEVGSGTGWTEGRTGTVGG